MLQDTTALKSLLSDPTLLETRAYIGGAFTDGEGTFDVINPARGDVIAQVADVSRAQVAGAIAQADVAQKEWAKWTGKERAIMLMAMPLGQSGPSVFAPIMLRFGSRFRYLTWDYRGFFGSDVDEQIRGHTLQRLSHVLGWRSSVSGPDRP